MLEKYIYIGRYIKWKSIFKLKEINRLRQQFQRKVRKYPNTIQLPLTYVCNFDCVMCGMKNLSGKKDFTAEELGSILKDPLFSKIEAVGVNGGEPFLKKDFEQCMDAILNELPALKAINIISNGYCTDKILKDLSCLKSKCSAKGVRLNLSISVDGYGKMQDFHRGRKNAFVNADRTCREIMNNKGQYVDGLDVICTITKHNISRINEVDVWSKALNIPVEYNIASLNRRIDNYKKENDFLLFSDRHARRLATEFFYCKYKETGKEKYFALYLYLRTHKRYTECPCMYNDWVTLTPDAQIGYCATRSKNLGSALETSAYELFNGNLKYLKMLKKKYCSECCHYSYRLNYKGLVLMHKDRMKNWFMR